LHEHQADGAFGTGVRPPPAVFLISPYFRWHIHVVEGQALPILSKVTRTRGERVHYLSDTPSQATSPIMSTCKSADKASAQHSTAHKASETRMYEDGYFHHVLLQAHRRRK